MTNPLLQNRAFPMNARSNHTHALSMPSLLSMELQTLVPKSAPKPALAVKRTLGSQA
jgi:hypothetical protein